MTDGESDGVVKWQSVKVIKQQRCKVAKIQSDKGGENYYIMMTR